MSEEIKDVVRDMLADLFDNSFTPKDIYQWAMRLNDIEKQSKQKDTENTYITDLEAIEFLKSLTSARLLIDRQGYFKYTAEDNAGAECEEAYTEPCRWTGIPLTERVAQLTAHRACCGSEHDPENGKLHGYCVVCGVPWPCQFAGIIPTYD